MHENAELRRAAEFLEELERNLALPLTNTVPDKPPSAAPQKQHSNNPQETHGAHPLKIPRICNREPFESE
jgi:hypothetical protein